MKPDRTFEEIFKRHFPPKRFPSQLLNHCDHFHCNREIQLPAVKQRHSPVVVRNKTTTAVGLNGLNDDGKTIRKDVAASALTEVERYVFLALTRRDHF